MQSKLNKLNGAVCYLSGSMEYAKDGGKQWREKIKALCVDNEINIKFIDPTNKPNNLMKENNNKVDEFKDTNNWNDFVNYMKQIKKEDCRCVDLSDFIIVRIDKSTHACGTYQEIVIAEAQNKPILAIVVGGKWNMPGWLAPMFKETEIFQSEEGCVNYIIALNDGNIELDKRWILMRDHL